MLSNVCLQYITVVMNDLIFHLLHLNVYHMYKVKIVPASRTYNDRLACSVTVRIPM